MSDSEYPRESEEHWRRVAPVFAAIPAPLKPCDADLSILGDAVGGWTQQNRTVPRVTVLGVTREYHDFPWPEGTDLIAVDRNQAMIDFIWPGPSKTVRLCDWREMCLPDGSSDIAVCDGGLSMLPFPGGIETVARQLTRVIVPGGIFVVRLYTPSDTRESTDHVIDDLEAGRIPNSSVLKVRLWMAVQENAESGMAVRAVWNTLHERVPDLYALARRIGWPEKEVATIEPYEVSNDHYYHPRIEDVVQTFHEHPGGFELQSITTPSYPAGEHCPTLVFRRVTAHR